MTCTAMFPQCMTRVNNPKDCDCPKAYSFRSDPDETRGRAVSRKQAETEARRSMGRKATLLPQPKPDQVGNVRNSAISDIMAPAKSKQDQNMGYSDLPQRNRILRDPEADRVFEELISLDHSPSQAFNVGWVEGRTAKERSIEEQFWSIVDRNGPSGLPSDMWEAIDILARKAGL